MLRALSIVAVLLSSPLVVARQDPPDLRARFEELDAANDRDGVVTLWRENPFEALQVIDSYLEGSLAGIEAGELERGSAEVRAMHERALRGARAADLAFDRAIFADYASSFTGWTADEATRFRAGQKAFGEHRAALKSGDREAALAHARECTRLAEPLGDWWGTAMGLGGEGAALHALGRDEEALVPLSRARLLNHELGLVGAEYANLRAMTEALVALGRTARAREAATSALVLADVVGDAAGKAKLAEMVKGFERGG